MVAFTLTPVNNVAALHLNLAYSLDNFMLELLLIFLEKSTMNAISLYNYKRIAALTDSQYSYVRMYTVS